MKTTDVGYLNGNKQKVMRATGLAGSDHMQYIYVLRCEHCSYEYGANGSDIFERKCPRCQGGAPGLEF
jgi:Zn finger protein HypA/HybF involved in hydrogenase expression